MPQSSVLSAGLLPTFPKGNRPCHLCSLSAVTMNTVLEMLRAQLKEAKAEAEAGHERVKELEYALVHRDTLLAGACQALVILGLTS